MQIASNRFGANHPLLLFQLGLGRASAELGVFGDAPCFFGFFFMLRNDSKVLRKVQPDITLLFFGFFFMLRNDSKVQRKVKRDIKLLFFGFFFMLRNDSKVLRKVQRDITLRNDSHWMHLSLCFELYVKIVITACMSARHNGQCK
jgi:hypothetical protein